MDTASAQKPRCMAVFCRKRPWLKDGVGWDWCLRHWWQTVWRLSTWGAVLFEIRRTSPFGALWAFCLFTLSIVAGIALGIAALAIAGDPGLIAISLAVAVVTTKPSS